GPEFDHMALLVHLDDDWLADVGFGDCFLEPLLLNGPYPDSFRIRTDGDYRIVERLRTGQEWTPQYRFTLRPHVLEDYVEMCHYMQTSPQSWFTKRRICTLPTAAGRITLSDDKLIVTTTSGREERVLGEAEWRAALEN